MTMKRIFLLSLLSLCLTTSLKAVPAYRGALKAAQPDGTVLTFYVHGDERSHEYVSVDGFRLMQDAEGAYRYVSLAADNTLTTVGSPLAHDPSLRSLTEQHFVGTLTKASELPRQISAMARVAQKEATTEGAASRFQIGTYPTMGKGKCLVLLVQFSDKAFVLDKRFHERMLNEPGFSDDGATGSARDFYYDQSQGRFDPQFDVVGPITLSHATSYYGADDSFGNHDTNAGKMINEACKLATSDFATDFSQYDGDGDGKVDMVYVIYAGYGQHAGGGTNTIWPHKYELSSWGISLELNGKTIDTYACSSELFGNSGTQSSGIGTVCHEFGHVLGLADHYNTTDNTQYMFGSYDIMDYGSYNNNSHTPPAYTAFERMALGWLTPEELTQQEDGLTLGHIAETNAAYIINTSTPDEFYLLENRQQTGWDQYLPGSGLMITHVDFNKPVWNSNTVNDDATHPRLYLVAADNERNFDVLAEKETEKYDLYPCVTRLTSNDSFTDVSTPAARPWTGETLDKWVTDIKNEGGLVSFNFMANHLNTPTGLKATVLSDNSFAAAWDGVERATSYDVNLYKLAYRSEQKTALAEGFDLMTAGSTDTPNATDVATTGLDAYMTTSGWQGTNVFQAGGWCQIGTATEGGSLTTPKLNMTRYDGEFAVAVHVKSFSGKSPVLSVSTNGLTGKTRITSTERTFLFKFTDGIADNRITFATNAERALIDSIVIVRGSVDGMFTGAKEVAVSGIPEASGSDAEDTDFLHVDTLSVTGLTQTAYTFTGLEPQTHYAFSVKAMGEGSSSEFSEEKVVYTDYATGISAADIKAEGCVAPAETYTLGGSPAKGSLRPGIYIVRQGQETKKIIVR